MTRISRFRGVSPSDSPTKPWRAKICVNGVGKHLGLFATEEAASAAYEAAHALAVVERDRRKTQNTWRHRQTLARLSWHYGPERAARMMAGHDPQASADLAAWNALGERKEAA